MKLKTAHIGDLTNMYFNIPDYQRGYRWETKQVKELLNDLLEFHIPKGNNQFYCLQPLVVVANNSIQLPQDAKLPAFDVVDGQQRLTTLFLIMSYLHLESYHIRYARASKNTDKNQFEDGELLCADLSRLTKEKIADNPDYFYLTQAREDIKSWFDENPGNEDLIKTIIFPTDDYKVPDKVFHEMNSDPNNSLQDVRFIWYDASKDSNEQKSYKNSIDIFKRLNYGKTSLTSAELIKALLFQCDIYSGKKKPEMKQVAFRMSTEWDSMEKKLQDKFMWAMIKPESYDKPSHIDIVLSFVAKQLVDKEGVVINSLKNDKYYDYLVFNKYMETKGYSEHTVKELWSRIQDVFAILKSWYEDLELYHLIGLQFMLRGTKDILSSMEEMKNQYENLDRADFIHWLKYEKIGKTISLSGRNIKDSDEPLDLQNIYYGEHNQDICNILLVYNVTLYIRHKQDQQRFPFYFCKTKNYIHSLEHIHPQHLHNEAIDFVTLCKWFMEKKEDVEIISEAKHNEKLQHAITNLTPMLELTKQEQKQGTSDSSFKKKESKYEENKALYSNYLKVIDKYFDELAEITETELHSLSNMALVDKDTNASLGNGLLNQKRKKLQQLSRKYEETDGAQGAVTFAGTWKVFNKEYATESDNPQKMSSAANLNYWTKLDRENYMKELTEIYNDYVNN